MKGLVGLLIIAVVVGAIYMAAPVLFGLYKSKEFIAAQDPYQQSPVRPSRRVLVVGDSTAVGVGARSADESVAGFLGREFPDIEIKNNAASGAKLADVRGQLNTEEEWSPDVVVVLAGGNDVLYHSSFETIREQTDALLSSAAEITDAVVFLPTGNLGNAPMFMWPLSEYMRYRSNGARELFERIAQRHNVGFVDIYYSQQESPFTTNQWDYFARDGLHLKGPGYRHWYRQLRPVLADQDPYFE